MISGTPFVRIMICCVIFGFNAMNVFAKDDSSQDELRQLEQLVELQRQGKALPQASIDNGVENPIDNNQLASNPVMTGASAEEMAMSEEAFSDMTKATYPMSPEQILRMRELYENTTRASSSPAVAPPRPTTTSQFVKLAPGSTPPVIRLAQGFVSAVVFLDSTGAVWPIASYTIGNPNAFNIQWNRKDNILMIQAKTLYTYGNLAVRLKNLDTPVMVMMIPGQKAVDYTAELHIPGFGPNAKTPIGEIHPAKENTLLLGILEGIPPSGSEELKVSDSEIQVWRFGVNVYVRTRHKILSPGWISSLQSADGMRSYELKNTPSILISKMGKIVNVSIKG